MDGAGVGRTKRHDTALRAPSMNQILATRSANFYDGRVQLLKTIARLASGLSQETRLIAKEAVWVKIWEQGRCAKFPFKIIGLLRQMAETVGFEPTIEFPL